MSAGDERSPGVPKEAPLRALLLAGRFEVRGSAAYTLRLAESLPEFGVAATIVTPDARLVPETTRSRIDVREYPRLDAPLWGRFVERSMLLDLAEDPPDVVHAQSGRVVRQAARLARALDRPLVLTVHEQSGHRAESWARLPIRRLIAVSRAVRSELVGRVRLGDDAIDVIHTGVAVSNVETQPVLDPGHVPVVGTAGPLEAVKGMPFLLGAAQRVLATGRDVEFLVAGAGPEEGSLRRIASRLGVAGHVTFVPNLREFTSSLAAMDVFCLPSLEQGLGTIMLEAMSLGKPVIASGVGGVYSVVRDGETGLVVPPSDSGRLAERIVELLDDPIAARELGENGRRLAREEFAVGPMAERTAGVYARVVREHADERSSALEREPAGPGPGDIVPGPGAR